MVHEQHLQRQPIFDGTRPRDQHHISPTDQHADCESERWLLLQPHSLHHRTWDSDRSALHIRDQPCDGRYISLLNTYFGLQFNGPNDVTWVTRGGKSYMFFTDDPVSVRYAPTSGIPAQLPDAVWRFDPQEQSLVPVISRADLLIPNGIRVNANQTILYVADTSATDSTPQLAGGAGRMGPPAIYAYDLDDDAIPINKRMIGISRTGVPDGIHIDDYGRIWTAEYEGVVVRRPNGKVLGLFNSEAFSVNQTLNAVGV